MAEWREMLRGARRTAGLSQGELARRMGESPKTIERLENARTGKPPRKRLLAACRALRLDDESTNAILQAAGLEPLSAFPASTARPLAELHKLLARLDFPVLAINSRVEIVAWNDAANRVAELDFGRDRPELRQRSLFRIAVDPHFLRRVVNWDEIISLMVRNFIWLDYDILNPAKDPVYFQALVADLMQSEKFPALMKMWQEGQPDPISVRGYFPAQWRVQGERILNFHCIHTGGDLFNAITLVMWYPADAQTWEWLRAGAAAVPASVPDAEGAPQFGGDDGESAGRLLHWARVSNGVTQRQLADAIGVTVALLTALENDKRRLTEPVIEAAARVLQMDAALANELRMRAGLDPLPSDWAPGVLTHAQAGIYYRFWKPTLEDNLALTRAYFSERVPERPFPLLACDADGTILSFNDLFALALPDALRGCIARGANLLDLLFSPALRACAADWQNMARVLLYNLLNRAPGYSRPRCDAAQIVRRIDAFASADPTLVPLMQELLADIATVSTLEWFPVTLALRTDEGTPLRYIAALETTNEWDTFWCFELHPGDGETWHWLNARAARVGAPAVDA